jgi:hypothetical protein
MFNSFEQAGTCLLVQFGQVSVTNDKETKIIDCFRQSRQSKLHSGIAARPIASCFQISVCLPPSRSILWQMTSSSTCWLGASANANIFKCSGKCCGLARFESSGWRGTAQLTRANKALKQLTNNIAELDLILADYAKRSSDG